MDRKIEFTDDDRVKTDEFAKKSTPTTFNRRKVSRDEHERNIRIGKLGEIAFAKFLKANNKSLLGSDDMFTVWDDIYTVDKMDFKTTDNKTIDIKTASQDFHTRILVPHDQYEQQRKDYYVGVRISADEKTAEVIGFVARQSLMRCKKGGYPSYAIGLNKLKDISELLEKIPSNS